MENQGVIFGCALDVRTGKNKQHFREKYWDNLALVEEFIVEIEGARKNCDVTRRGQFTDIKDINTFFAYLGLVCCNCAPLQCFGLAGCKLMLLRNTTWPLLLGHREVVLAAIPLRDTPPSS
jgi:hypothetical protein